MFSYQSDLGYECSVHVNGQSAGNWFSIIPGGTQYNSLYCSCTCVVLWDIEVQTYV